MRNLVIATAIATLWATTALAGDACSAPAACDPTVGCAPGCCDPGLCDRCGCQKKCQVVCEMKKVKKTVWVVECEDFCAPLPRCGRGCDSCCDPGACDPGCGADPAACGNGGCGQCAACCGDPCASLECRDYVPPKCGKVRTKKHLVKKEIECEIPVYKCVVVCCGCNDPGCCDPGTCTPAACDAPDGQEQPAPAPATTLSAPMPPVIGTSYVK